MIRHLEYFISTPSNSGLRRLVEYDKRASPRPSLSNAPTIGDTTCEAQPDEPVVVQGDIPDDDDDNYVGLDFKRVPYLEQRQVERCDRGGPKSWIYKNHLAALWKVPNTHITARDGVHYRDGWLDNNHRAFLRMWQERSNAAVDVADAVTPPQKKPRLGLSASPSAFLQSSIETNLRQVEASWKGDEYEIWRRQPAVAEEDRLSLNPLLYYESVARQFSVLSKFAINILTIPAAAADCERTFSELGDMLGTRRLQMKPELVAALQSLKS